MISKLYLSKDVSKMSKEVINRYFTKEDIQKAKNLLKRCSVSLATREKQIKSKMIYHFINTGMTKMKNKILLIPSADKDVEQLDLLYFAGGNEKWYGHSRKVFDSFM